MAAKIWYLKNVRFLLGHPVYLEDPISYKSLEISTLEGRCVLFLTDLTKNTPQFRTRQRPNDCRQQSSVSNKYTAHSYL